MKEVSMSQEEVFEELLNFFKALSDANRLKIIGLLAQKRMQRGTVIRFIGRKHINGIPPFTNAVLCRIGFCTGRRPFLLLFAKNGCLEING